jgi:maltose O-acetyltransferase
MDRLPRGDLVWLDIGCGSVVTKDMEVYAIVAGNPARKIGERNRELGYELRFDPFLI